jgi:hypothetical protein
MRIGDFGHVHDGVETFTREWRETVRVVPVHLDQPGGCPIRATPCRAGHIVTTANGLRRDRVTEKHCSAEDEKSHVTDPRCDAARFATVLAQSETPSSGTLRE